METDIKKEDGVELFQYREVLVTVDVPGVAAERVAKVSAALAKVSDPIHIDAFWIPPELMHVTLLHLGRVREDLIILVQECIQETLADMAPFGCRVGHLSLHTPAQIEGEEEPVPDALWADIDDRDGKLTALRDRIANDLEEMGIEHHSPTPFQPHVAVALFAKFRNTREFGSVLLEQDAGDRGEVPVREVVVLENRAAAGQREQPFRPLKRLELKGA